MTNVSDLTQITLAFNTINQGEIIALCNEGSTQSAGHEIAYEIASDKGGDPDAYSVIFWHNQSHDAFDEAGNLVSSLYLHWSGKKVVLTKALSDHIQGFEIKVPNSDSAAFVIQPKEVNPEDFDPTNKVHVLKYLDQLRQNSISSNALKDEDLAIIRQILRKSAPQTLILAVQLAKNHLDIADIEVLHKRVSEIVPLEPGMQIWENPGYAIGNLLDLMQQQQYPEYQDLFQAWIKHDAVALREGIAKHALHNIQALTTLLLDPEHAVRWAAVHSLLASEEPGIQALIDAAKDPALQDQPEIIRMIKSYAGFDEVVADLLKESDLE